MSKLDEILKNQPVKIDFITLLLACPSIENRASRDNLLKGVRNGGLLANFDRNATNRIDVENVVNTLLKYSGALEEFITYVQQAEEGSDPVMALQKFLANLTKIEALTTLDEARKKPSPQAQGEARVKLDQHEIVNYNLHNLVGSFKSYVDLAGIFGFVIPCDQYILENYILVRLQKGLLELNPNCKPIEFHLHKSRLDNDSLEVAICKGLESQSYGNPESWFRNKEKSDVLLTLLNGDSIEKERVELLVQHFYQQLNLKLLSKLEKQGLRLVIIYADTSQRGITIKGFNRLDIEEKDKHNPQKLEKWFTALLKKERLDQRKIKKLAQQVGYHPNLAGAFREMVKISKDLTGRIT
ncbi:MAG: hypothetical protein WCS37_19960 [Chloroflexota bacterium]